MKSRIARKIAGEIVLSENPGKVMKKWREIFGIKQSELAEKMNVSSSVICDYENSRRKSPGVDFVRRYIKAMMEIDKLRGEAIVNKFSSYEKKHDAIIDIREFLEPIDAYTIKKILDCAVLVDNDLKKKKILGYTVIDSLKAIMEMSTDEFMEIYGLSTQRALVFTKVHFGRSPMIAIKVTKPKPPVVIFHGVKPESVDKLGIKIAKSENISLLVSRIADEKTLVNNLRKLRL